MLLDLEIAEKDCDNCGDTLKPIVRERKWQDTPDIWFECQNTGCKLYDEPINAGVYIEDNVLIAD